jgi:hypothetical protein
MKSSIQVTFTGVDERTDFARIVNMFNSYNVEWAVLMSPSRQGIEPRYPAHEAVERFRSLPVRKAAHLCGKYARMVMRGEDPGVSLYGFDRVQVNHPNPDPEAVRKYASANNVHGIIQSRDASSFPKHDGAYTLFDQSGGVGLEPEAWPPCPDWFVGYAGGLNADNVCRVLEYINPKTPCWIDMETGVRTDDWLDLDKCEAVLNAVLSFGAKP